MSAAIQALSQAYARSKLVGSFELMASVLPPNF